MNGIVENGIPMVDADTPRSMRRFLAAGIMALLLHAVLIAVPLINNMQKIATDTGPVIVDFEADAIQTQSAPDAAAAVAVAQAPAQVAVAAPKAAPAAQAASDYTIPTPKASSQPQTAVPAGQAFKETGGKTGTVSSALVTSVPTGISPNVPAATSSQTQIASAGSATSAPPSKGEGVLVTTGQTNQSAGGSPDYVALDKALAGAKPGPQSAGQTGSPQPTVQPGRIGEPQIQWEKPEEAKNRKLVSRPNPKLPAWVATYGLALKVTVSFTVNPDGTVSVPHVDKSSGYADVDAAVADAVRQWRFSPDSSTKAIRGMAPIVIQPL